MSLAAVARRAMPIVGDTRPAVACPPQRAAEAIDPLEFLLELSRQPSSVVCHESSGMGPTFLVNDPELVGQVLRSPHYPRATLLRAAIGDSVVATEGPHWRGRRKLMGPPFQREQVATFESMITRMTARMLDDWQVAAANGQSIDVSRDLLRTTVAIVSNALFDADLDGQTDALIDAVQPIVQYLGDVACTLFGAPMVFTRGRLTRFQDAKHALDAFSQSLIDKRRMAADKSHDLMTSLLEASDTASGQPWSASDLRDEVSAMLIAGHENTGWMITWSLHLLAEHPAAEQRLHEELSKVLSGRIPTMDDLPRLEYTRMVLNESMRLYPPVWQLSRKAARDDELGGHVIPRGAAVVVSPYTMHRHPTWWNDPEEFLPERFSAEASAGRPRHAFFPFGDGPHRCLGEHFAMVEGQLILAMIGQRFLVRPAIGHVVEPAPWLTLRMLHGYRGTLTPRDTAGTARS
jgi:cytochrome P450